jgi:DNA-binding Xre family transcriptional regulator
MRYLAIIAKDQDHHVGFFADPLPALAAGTREEVLEQLPEMLLEVKMGKHRHVQPKAQNLTDADPQAIEGYEALETVWIECGDINPTAQAIHDAMLAAKVRPAELARRMGITRAAVGKLIDPGRTSSYTLETLEKVARALEMQLEPPRFVGFGQGGSSQAVLSS